MSEESRADRIRERRKASSEKTDDSSESTEPSKTEEQDKRSKLDKPTETEKSVKSQQEGTYMYLPTWQKRELNRHYTMLKAEYEYEYEEDFEKNRHFYPIVIQMALNELDGMGAGEIKEQLDEMR